MVEVFKTDVQKISDAKNLVAVLLKHLPGTRINFDLEDCDKVLRVEGKNFVPERVMVLIKQHGFTCNTLE